MEAECTECSRHSGWARGLCTRFSTTVILRFSQGSSFRASAVAPAVMEEKKTYPVVAWGYNILEEVGQGVSATVYRAMCLPFSEIMAIKSLDLEKCNSNLDEIRREAQTMSLISHANVVKADQAHGSYMCWFTYDERDPYGSLPDCRIPPVKEIVRRSLPWFSE